MPLVMFLDACEHCARICNILRHCQNMSLFSTCQSMALSYEFVELNHWIDKVVSWASQVATSFYSVSRSWMSRQLVIFTQLFNAASMQLTNCNFHFTALLVVIVGGLGCRNLILVILLLVEIIMHLILLNKSCVFSSNKVGGSGRQSLTRLSTHMNVP